MYVMNEFSKTDNIVEAILFWKGEPMTAKELAKITKLPEKEVAGSLQRLKSTLENKGVILQELAGEYSLGTSTEASQLIEEVTKEELSKDLGKASLETLSIILYKGPVRRSDIDHVRGVNSTFILRNLLIRGLITKKPSPTDSRTSIYEPSMELLSYLGVESLDKLPNFELVKTELENFHTGADNTHTQANDLQSKTESVSTDSSSPPMVAPGTGDASENELIEKDTARDIIEDGMDDSIDSELEKLVDESLSNTSQ